MTTENNIQYKNMYFEKAEVDELREFTATITDESIDRDSEVLLASGMNKKDFVKNGIILFNHNRDFPVCTALSLRRKGDGWVAKGKIAEGVQRADDVWALIKQGVLKGISVGFQILEQRPPTAKDLKDFGKDVTNVISKWKLLEFSVVSIPANQNALITAAKDLNIDPKEILGNDYKEEVVEETKEVEVVEAEPVVIDTKDMVEEVEKQLEELDIEIKETTKEKIVEAVKDSKVDMNEVIKYFKEEIIKQIKRSKGNLF